MSRTLTTPPLGIIDQKPPADMLEALTGRPGPDQDWPRPIVNPIVWGRSIEVGAPAHKHFPGPLVNPGDVLEHITVFAATSAGEHPYVVWELYLALPGDVSATVPERIQSLFGTFADTASGYHGLPFPHAGSTYTLPIHYTFGIRGNLWFACNQGGLEDVQGGFIAIIRPRP